MTNSDRLKYIEYIRGYLNEAEDAMNERDEEAYWQAIDHADALIFVLMHENDEDDTD